MSKDQTAAPLKVRITKCSDPEWLWYKDKIGEEFEVTDLVKKDNHYILWAERKQHQMSVIRKEDCEVITKQNTINND